MTTRNLPRTIIEGGKRESDKQERREQIQRDRRVYRDFCHTYCDEDNEPTVRVKHYYREFDDRLSPLMKWLESQVGRKWNDVYSDLCAMENRRSLRGYHFLTHAIGAVSLHPDPDSRYRRNSARGLYVEDGILKNEPYKRTRWRINKDLLARYQNWITEERRVRLVGSKYFWFVRTRMMERSTVIFSRSNSGEAIPFVARSWRQDAQLTKKETGYMSWLRNRDERVWKEIMTWA